MSKWGKVLFGLKVARKVMVAAGDAGLRIKGIDPSKVDAAAEAGAKSVIESLKKEQPGPRPVPPAA